MPKEKEILQVKYQAQPFRNLDDLSLIGFIQGLLVRIQVITGWALPEAKEQRAILNAELCSHFKEKWSNYNVEEVIYSIKNFAPESYGKSINLLLIDEAMAVYAEKRLSISQEEEQKAYKKETLALPVHYNPLELVQTFYQEFLNKELKLDSMPARVYEIIKEKIKPKFTEEEKIQFSEQAKDHVIHVHQRTYRSMDTATHLGKTNELRDDVETLKSLSGLEIMKYLPARKYAFCLAAINWFHKIQEQGITNIVEYFQD